MRYLLNGRWELSFTSPYDNKKITAEVTVPTNAEKELFRLGLLKDPMPADDYRAAEDFERVDDWTYVKRFTLPSLAEGYTRELVLDGIDTVADIYINGELSLSCANMHRQWRIPAEKLLCEGENELTVVIRSADRYAREKADGIFPLCRNGSMYSSMAHIRKARHSWGWDNAPRLLTSGIYRSVYVEDLPCERFDEVYLCTQSINKTHARIGIHWNYRAPLDSSMRDRRIRYTVESEGQVVYEYEEEVFFPRGAHRPKLPLDKIKLWWPYGFGEPSLCRVTLCMLRDGEELASYSQEFGIRTLRLEESDLVDEKGEGSFLFYVNEKPLMIRGTNWKPASPFHSEADAKALEILPFAKECNCNMIRIWGGGIYEDSSFFEWCDKNGILVWQDFMFACEMPALTEEYRSEVYAEAEYIVKKLRNHCSLALWCGDNEIDNFIFDSLGHGSAFLPEDRKISRETLRDAVRRNDPYRYYTASSPRYSDRMVKERLRGNKRLSSVETHLYTNREFALALRESRACFIGETGPIGFNAMTDNEAIFARERERCERLWDETEIPYPVVDVHQSDSYFIRWRLLGKEQCIEWFGRDFSLDEWRDYCLAINTVCGDIFKDVIEYSRVMRWRKSGVLWWSLCDMWQMLFNYSVIDSDLRPKLPFYLIKESQRDLALAIVRKEYGGRAGLYALNDTLEVRKGEYTVTAYPRDGEARVVARGTYLAEPNAASEIAAASGADEPQLLLISFTDGKGGVHYNHFLGGRRPYDFETMKKWNALLLEKYRSDN